METQIEVHELTGLAGQILEDMKKPAKKFSEKQLAVLQASTEVEKARKAANKKFVTDFGRLPFINPAIISTLLRRIHNSDQNAWGLDATMPVRKEPLKSDVLFDRMALKVLTCLRRGWTISEPHDLIFFGELTDEEACMTEEKFCKHLEATPKIVSLSRSKRVEMVETVVIRRCALGRKCLKAVRSLGAEVPGNGKYCSKMCLGRATALKRAPVGGLTVPS